MLRFLKKLFAVPPVALKTEQIPAQPKASPSPPRTLDTTIASLSSPGATAEQTTKALAEAVVIVTQSSILESWTECEQRTVYHLIRYALQSESPEERTRLLRPLFEMRPAIVDELVDAVAYALNLRGYIADEGQTLPPSQTPLLDPIGYWDKALKQNVNSGWRCNAKNVKVAIDAIDIILPAKLNDELRAHSMVMQGAYTQAATKYGVMALPALELKTWDHSLSSEANEQIFRALSSIDDPRATECAVLSNVTSNPQWVEEMGSRAVPILRESLRTDKFIIQESTCAKIEILKNIGDASAIPELLNLVHCWNLHIITLIPVQRTCNISVSAMLALGVIGDARTGERLETMEGEGAFRSGLPPNFWSTLHSLIRDLKKRPSGALLDEGSGVAPVDDRKGLARGSRVIVVQPIRMPLVEIPEGTTGFVLSGRSGSFECSFDGFDGTWHTGESSLSLYQHTAIRPTGAVATPLDIPVIDELVVKLGTGNQYVVTRADIDYIKTLGDEGRKHFIAEVILILSAEAYVSDGAWSSQCRAAAEFYGVALAEAGPITIKALVEYGIRFSERIDCATWAAQVLGEIARRNDLSQTPLDTVESAVQYMSGRIVAGVPDEDSVWKIVESLGNFGMSAHSAREVVKTACGTIDRNTNRRLWDIYNSTLARIGA